MSNGYLGDNLGPELRKVFMRRLESIARRAGELKHTADREFVVALSKQIEREADTFQASSEQTQRLQELEQLLIGEPDMSKLVDRLLAEGASLLGGNSLPSGRMLSLGRLLDKAEEGKLSKKQIDDLQKLVQEAKSGLNEES